MRTNSDSAGHLRAIAWAAFDGGNPRERFPIATAPRDGTLIVVGDPDTGEFPMRWAHIQRNGLFPGVVGMWVMEDGGMTWNEADGFGPTSWRPTPHTAPLLGEGVGL